MRKCDKNSNQLEPRAPAQWGRLACLVSEMVPGDRGKHPPHSTSRVHYPFPPYLTECPSNIEVWPWKVSLEEDAFCTPCPLSVASG